jgi:hypothetical protein
MTRRDQVEPRVTPIDRDGTHAPLISIHLVASCCRGAIEREIRERLLRSLAERLPLLRRINAIEPDHCGALIDKDRERVAVGNTDHTAGERLGSDCR